MSGVPSSPLEDSFQCPICLNVFSEPVSTPCGHSFCKSCLGPHWDNQDVRKCPLCNKRFHGGPAELSTNAVMADVCAQIKRRKVETLESVAAESEVKCDVCTDLKLKASKSCLVCWVSFCHVHLEPHRRLAALRRHTLIEPVESPEERTCASHEKILELFCRDDQTFTCSFCTDHSGHDVVTVEEEGTRQKENIESTKAKIQLMIDERREKINKFMNSSEMAEENRNRVIGDSDALFSALTRKLQEMQAKVNSDIQKKCKKFQEKSARMIEELHEEIADLQKKASALEEVYQTQDHFQLLQTLQEVNVTSDSKNWSQIRVNSDLYTQTLRRAASHIVSTFQVELKTLTNMELNKMRLYKESVTFNESTAGGCLVVSEFGKRLRHVKGARRSSLDDDSQRFACPMVFGTEGFTSGRHYWEVRVGQRGDWDVGVAKETVDRKGDVISIKHGFYAIGKSGGGCYAGSTPRAVLNLPPGPRNIGIYLDYEVGRVSFYDVDEKLHLHSFTRQTFTGKLLPFFYLYSWAKKSQPLVLPAIYDEALLLALAKRSNAAPVAPN